MPADPKVMAAQTSLSGALSELATAKGILNALQAQAAKLAQAIDDQQQTVTTRELMAQEAREHLNRLEQARTTEARLAAAQQRQAAAIAAAQQRAGAAEAAVAAAQAEQVRAAEQLAAVLEGKG